MYLFSELEILPLLFIFLLWGAGGWLMTLRWFDLETHERGLIGCERSHGADDTMKLYESMVSSVVTSIAR